MKITFTIFSGGWGDLSPNIRYPHYLELDYYRFVPNRASFEKKYFLPKKFFILKAQTRDLLLRTNSLTLVHLLMSYNKEKLHCMKRKENYSIIHVARGKMTTTSLQPNLEEELVGHNFTLTKKKKSNNSI